MSAGDPRPLIDRRALGRRLSRLAGASVDEVLALAAADDPSVVPRPRIGITGPPGAGKSSLGGRLAIQRAASRRIGLLAIDPSSPHSGGAILGDRIRMDELPGIEQLYVRSLASRGAGDGLARNIPELLHAMDVAGFDEVLLETVGVGQAEHAVRDQVDTLLLVLNPESGDVVQAMKAGIMEMADLYVINKSDLPGAPRVAAEITRVLHLANAVPGGWQPQVLMTSIREPESIAQLSRAIDAHQAWAASAVDPLARRVARARYRLRSLLERRAVEAVQAMPAVQFELPLRAQLEDAQRRMK